MCILCNSVLSCSLTKIGRLRKMKWLAHCWMVLLAAPPSLIFLYSILTWIPLRITLDWAALVCGEESWIAMDVTQMLASQSNFWGGFEENQTEKHYKRNKWSHFCSSFLNKRTKRRETCKAQKFHEAMKCTFEEEQNFHFFYVVTKQNLSHAFLHERVFTSPDCLN